ncbi:MAG TPA: SpoVR family protein [Gemmatales bacterium]|nr:SpoVR family protein [Gemmatales bacterium]HMP59575.1 SpoVR family protein [Gemmatales bacterium]
MTTIRMPYDTRLTPELRSWQLEIESYARSYGLDFYETIFELLDADDLNEVAAYGGFPTRYPHWSFGMQYEELRKGYEFGLSKIYEMVINNDPCYAYLMRSNHLVDQKLVMAHVYGHCDFFKNNQYFAHTSRKMMDEMANHGARIRRYAEKHGEDEVETFLDRCMSIDDLIDIHSTFIKRRATRSRYDFSPEPEAKVSHATRFQSKGYMDAYINPPQVLQREEEEWQKQQEQMEKRFPEQPERDVLHFLIEHAPLKPWQRDILSIIRDEAYYFAPQGQTKIMNEGWASYFHSTIMTQKALHASEVIDYCDHHSGTLASSGPRLNPYKLGIELFRDIERRWNMGQFGKEWEECDNDRAKSHWDKQLGLGRAKIFEVRRIHNDVTFIDTFLTADFCKEHGYFAFNYDEHGHNYVVESRAFKKVKQRLLFNLTNHGRPFISVVDGNFKNRGELLLRHDFQGQELRVDHAQDTLANVQALWSRPVHLATVLDDKPTLLSFDGTDHSQKGLGEHDDPRRHSASKS